MSEPREAPSAATNAQLLRPGEVVDGRYRVEAFLGGGGMASVYRATHMVLEQPVALKVVCPQIREVPGVAARFIREARAATSLKGEHVARVFDVGTMADGAPYMVMEFLEGKDLGELLEMGQRPSIEDAVDWTLQACEALAEVHGRGIVHRDLKPANLFLTRGADGLLCVKLIDFGISRFESPLSPKDAHGLTQPDAIMGSPRYMSPEMMESATNADARSDIWGLGAVLYELLVGDAPYDGGSFIEIYRKALDGPPVPASSIRSDVPKELDEVVFKCLRANPDERFSDVAELAEALAPFGNDAAQERVAAIARVLGATRARPADGGAVPIEDLSPSQETSRVSSRVRRRVSREEAAPSRAKRIAFFVTAAIALVGIGAIGARAKITRPREETPTIAATTETTNATPPAASATPVPADTTDEDDEPTPTTHAAAAASASATPSSSATPARTNADRRRRAPRHSAPPPSMQAAPFTPPTPPVPTPAPSPSPDNGTLFEDRK